MAFSGLPFLLGFLPLFLAGSVLVGTRRLAAVWMKCWLIVVSIGFYAWAAADFLPLLLLSVAGNYAILLLTSRSRIWTVVGVGANLALLGAVKLGASGPMPLGISFFTFGQIGCLLHVSEQRDDHPAPIDYALFVLFFPALIAGPVLNPRDMLPQLQRREWRVATRDLQVGLGFFMLGLLKKTVLADPLAPVVAAGFADPAGLTLFPAWQAAAGYSLQLYFDFSGYTDMAIGLAWIVGLRFPDNFEQPYRARCVIAYWQRWHMSLTRFLVANVHAPLTMAIMRWRRRHGLRVDQTAQRTLSGFLMMLALPVVATMLLIALWHGDAATYLLFGGLHAVFLLVNHGWRLLKGPALPDLANLAVTYLAVLLAAVVFRADSVADAAGVLGGMMGLHGGARGVWDGRDAANLAWLAGLYGIVWFAPTTRQIMLSGSWFAWRESAGWAAIMGGAATLGVLAAGGTGEFLYFRF